MRVRYVALFWAIMAGACFWLLDAVLCFLFFHGGTFLDLLVLNVGWHHFVIRLLAIFVAALFAFLAGKQANQRCRAEQTLQAREERFRVIIESAPFRYYRIGKDGLWQYVNPQWERMHGYSCQEVVGKHFDITQPELAKEQARECVRRALSGEVITDESPTWSWSIGRSRTRYGRLFTQPSRSRLMVNSVF